VSVSKGLTGRRGCAPTHSYYHTDSRPYTAKIAQHWQLAGKAPWMASGTWTWSRCASLCLLSLSVSLLARRLPPRRRRY